MVLYFKSTVVAPPMTIFMGLDKYENEELIKWGWPEDVWFHVDKVSSAHVYLRLQQDQSLDDVPTSVLEDCAQLVKANSISGNKMNNVDVVYTMWHNLKKTASMEVGQVTFHNQKEVRMIRVEKRLNEVVNRLNKTKTESTNVDLRSEKEERDRKERDVKKQSVKEQKEKEKDEAIKKAEAQKLKSYSSLMNTDKMKSNQDEADDDSDDFM